MVDFKSETNNVYHKNIKQNFAKTFMRKYTVLTVRDVNLSIITPIV